MAETTVSKTEQEDQRLDKKVRVKSIAPWLTGARRQTTAGDISIPARGSVLLTREEVIAQGQNGNKLLTGIDGQGGHATWYVDDTFTRQELGFDDGARKQIVLTEDTIKKLFELKTQKAFEDNITKNVKTRAEKAFLMNAIQTLGLNDFTKIAFCIKYTGINI